MTYRMLADGLLRGAWGQLTCFFAITLLLTLLLWSFWWHPIQREQQRLAQQSRLQSQRYRQQLHALRTLPSLAALQRQTEHLQHQLRPATPVAFSLPAMLEASGAVLEYWHPVGKGGELALHLEWSQFIALLNYLSSLQPVLPIPRFSLQHDAQQLRLVMELTDEH